MCTEVGKMHAVDGALKHHRKFIRSDDELLTLFLLSWPLGTDTADLFFLASSTVDVPEEIAAELSTSTCMSYTKANEKGRLEISIHSLVICCSH